ncbi:ABC transporter permease subunit [Agrobacterium rhizogenes]|nr:ABC transporter permease subunit [Rhizobium rhizogenes]NTG32004.1 ABC transporter permease subunit [Rhizobium rhizogenes]
MYGFFDQFRAGLVNTLLVFLMSGALGTVLALLVAIVKTSSNRTAIAIARAYTGLVRGVPELLIILVVYFGATAALSRIVGRYVEINALAAGVTALTIVFVAYAAEIFRGAINAIPKGQAEAAMTLGLTPWQRWILIIIPQMVPTALPAYGNLCISLIKDTSLISVVGLIDVMRVAYVGAGALRAPLSFYLAASAIYLTLTSLSLLSFRFIEQRFSIPHVKG